jgi:hypothetical protein
MSRESEEKRWSDLKASNNKIKSASNRENIEWNPFPSIQIDSKHDDLVRGIDICVRSLQDIKGSIERNNLDSIGYKIDDLERSINRLSGTSDDVSDKLTRISTILEIFAFFVVVCLGVIVFR